MKDLVIMGLCGIGVGVGLTILYAYLRLLKLQHDAFEQTYRKKIPEDIDSSKLCKESHSWIKVEALDKDEKDQMVVRDTLVCQVCGFISGTQKMANEETIDNILEKQKLESIEQRIYKEFLDKEDEEIKKFFLEDIEKGLDFNKVISVHASGISFSARYKLYLITKLEDIKKEMKSSN